MNGLNTIHIRQTATVLDTARRRDFKRTQMAPSARSLARTERISARVSDLSATDASAALRLGILRRLDQFGPQEAREIPRAWPVTRFNIRAAVRWLVADGLVEVGRYLGSRNVIRMTDHGRRVLDEIDWTETVRSMERDGEL
jgi:hypothetical protein